ncbi:MAG: pyroglutamyl-peptidase I [Polaromonas sp.]
MQKVLLTGFEPFDGDTVNPSWEIARALDGESLGEVRIVARQLPCVFGRAPEALAGALAQEPFALVVALGMAGTRTGISVERVAININDARIPDNAGQQPIDTPVVPGGPAAYFSTLPIKRMVAALQAKGIAASVSQTAGTFVCNHVFYALAHQLAVSHPATRGGFIHVPVLPQQLARHPGSQALPLATQVTAIRAAIAAALDSTEDARLGGGSLD